MKSQLLTGVLSGLLAIAAFAVVQRYTRNGDTPSHMTVVRLGGLPVRGPVYAGDIATFADSAGSPSQAPVYLSRQIGELNLDRVPLEQALPALAARAGPGVNLIVQWRQLEAAGVDQNTRVTLRLRDVTLGQALALALKEAGGSSAELAYATPANFLIVSTREHLDGDSAVIHVYDIRPLIRDAVGFRESLRRYASATRPTTRPAVANESNAGTGRRGGGGGGGGLFGGGGRIPPPFTDEEEAVQELQTLIQDLFDVSDWIDNGGRFAHNHYWCGRLIVRSRPSTHRQIEALLHQLQRLASADNSAAR